MMNWLPQAVGALLLLAITVLLYVNRANLVRFLQANTTQKQRDLLAQLGQEAFVYAETAFQGYDGPAKLNEAIKYIITKADRLGLEADLQELRAVIENAWLADKRSSGTPLRVDNPKVYEPR